jgi:hypothetical protein
MALKTPEKYEESLRKMFAIGFYFKLDLGAMSLKITDRWSARVIT